MKRILIIGICGSGKSYLAKQLKKKFNLPVIHLDKEFWKSGWVVTPQSEWKIKVKELLKQKSWIMDGNFSSTLNIRIPVADTIIYLDFNRYTALYNVLKRVFNSYGKVRSDLADNCPERFDWEFMKYVWKFPKIEKPKTEKALQNFTNQKKIIRLKNRNEVNSFIKSLTK